MGNGIFVFLQLEMAEAQEVMDIGPGIIDLRTFFKDGNGFPILFKILEAITDIGIYIGQILFTGVQVKCIIEMDQGFVLASEIEKITPQVKFYVIGIGQQFLHVEQMSVGLNGVLDQFGHELRSKQPGVPACRPLPEMSARNYGVN